MWQKHPTSAKTSPQRPPPNTAPCGRKINNSCKPRAEQGPQPGAVSKTFLSWEQQRWFSFYKVLPIFQAGTRFKSQHKRLRTQRTQRWSQNPCFLPQRQEKMHNIHKVRKTSYMKITAAPPQSDPQTQQSLSYLKSSLISLTVAWKGMFLTRILEVFCFLAVCFFLADFTAGLEGSRKGRWRAGSSKTPLNCGSLRIWNVGNWETSSPWHPGLCQWQCHTGHQGGSNSKHPKILHLEVK